MGKKIKWRCPHCNDGSGTMAADHEQFDWMFDHMNDMKQLWQCSSCYGYYFVYYTVEKITALSEIRGK